MNFVCKDTLFYIPSTDYLIYFFFKRIIRLRCKHYGVKPVSETEWIRFDWNIYNKQDILNTKCVDLITVFLSLYVGVAESFCGRCLVCYSEGCGFKR